MVIAGLAVEPMLTLRKFQWRVEIEVCGAAVRLQIAAPQSRSYR